MVVGKEFCISDLLIEVGEHTVSVTARCLECNKFFKLNIVNQRAISIANYKQHCMRHVKVNYKQTEEEESALHEEPLPVNLGQPKIINFFKPTTQSGEVMLAKEKPADTSTGAFSTGAEDDEHEGQEELEEIEESLCFPEELTEEHERDQDHDNDFCFAGATESRYSAQIIRPGLLPVSSGSTVHRNDKEVELTELTSQQIVEAQVRRGEIVDVSAAIQDVGFNHTLDFSLY